MKLPRYVKPQPQWWNAFPFLRNYSGNTIYPYIYLRKDIYEGLLEKSFFPRGLSVLKHEECHIRQHRKYGVITYRMRYLFSPRFRFQQEIEAYLEMMKVLKANKLPFDIDKIARCLSGWMYLWGVSYPHAKKVLEKVWREI